MTMPNTCNSRILIPQTQQICLVGYYSSAARAPCTILATFMFIETSGKGNYVIKRPFAFGHRADGVCVDVANFRAGKVSY